MMAAVKDGEKKEDGVCRTEETVGPTEPVLYVHPAESYWPISTRRWLRRMTRRRAREAYWVGGRGKVDRVSDSDKRSAVEVCNLAGAGLLAPF